MTWATSKATTVGRIREHAAWWGVTLWGCTFIGLHNVEAMDKLLAEDPGNAYVRGRLANYESILQGEILEKYEWLRAKRLPLGWV